MITSRMSAYTVANGVLRTVRTGLGHRFDGGPLARPEPPVDGGPPLRRQRRERTSDDGRDRVVGAQRIVEQRHAEREQLGERGGDAGTCIDVADECVEQRVGMTQVVPLLARRPGGDRRAGARRTIRPAPATATPRPCRTASGARAPTPTRCTPPRRASTTGSRPARGETPGRRRPSALGVSPDRSEITSS